MIGRVSSTKKEKQAKRKNRAKKQRLSRKKRKKTIQRNKKCGVAESRFICSCKQLLDRLNHTATHTCFEKLIWLYQNHFSLHRRFLKLVELYLSLIQIYI